MNKLCSIPVSINEGVLDVFTVFNEELDESDFQRLTHWLVLALDIVALDSDVGVGDDGLLDEVLELLRDLNSQVEGVRVLFSVVVGDVGLLAELVLGN